MCQLVVELGCGDCRIIDLSNLNISAIGVSDNASNETNDWERQPKRLMIIPHFELFELCLIECFRFDFTSLPSLRFLLTIISSEIAIELLLSIHSI